MLALIFGVLFAVSFLGFAITSRTKIQRCVTSLLGCGVYYFHGMFHLRILLHHWNI